MALSNHTLRTLLEPFLSPFGEAAKLPDGLIDQISIYLDLLVRWNARVSLTAVRRPEEIVERHFGESLFTGLHLRSRLAAGASLLDYGSGPGFPGLPIQMLLPELRVTVAESQARKVAFLREVIRSLEIRAEVWPHRVEELAPEVRFDAVTLRAVEKMAAVVPQAQRRVREAGWVAALAGGALQVDGATEFAIPGTERRRLLLWQSVPRGTLS